jgi:hypothetical protein
LVHRRLRHRRPQGGEGPARRAEVSRRNLWGERECLLLGTLAANGPNGRLRRVGDLCRELRERLLSAPLAVIRRQYGQ